MTEPVAEPVARLAHTMATRALGWLHHNRERGRFPAETTADLTDPNSTYKSLGESALAASLLLREGLASPAEQRLARELLDFCWSQLGNGDLLYERQVQFPAMTDPLEVYGPLARSGYRHRRLHELLTHLHGLTSQRGTEHVPNRRLAVASASRMAGLGDEADWPALLGATWLGHTPEPWAIDWMTAYCLTHTVFHATDWGARPGDLPAHLREYLETWLPVWLDIWCEVKDWDLVIELLIVDACLPHPRSDPEIWRRVAAAQHGDGLMPRSGEPVTEDPDEAFHAHHHTTVVAAIAGALAVSRHRGAAAAV
ncbi:DUF6895 family protein [Streptomyces hoynatensis]|uniref:DUF6895 domain-containing protein n=1 Tax=Streptomyces hoynatensis TaxID=1141874 RepID=A0A3A9YVE0_9ACTN|nr:hypothetical protein [Streptomyces hoynatensis]RKN40081.1 hypothetical protein D7294_19410 [Streptomyces hoynatensis]